MFTTVSSQVHTNTLLRLINYLQAHAGDGDVSAAINTAVEFWLDAHDDAYDDVHDGKSGGAIVDHDGRPGGAKQSACAHAQDNVLDATEAAFPRGYQWKSLFLPEGTVLRSWSYGEHNYARVEGDRIMHQGRAVSPNQFARLFTRTTRNAWFDLSVRFPGEKHYRMAGLLRKELAAQQQREQEREREHEVSAAQSPQDAHTLIACPSPASAKSCAPATTAASTSPASAPAAATPAVTTPTIATAAGDHAPTPAFPAELVPTLASAIAQALVVSRYEAVPRSEAVKKSDFDGAWDLPERRKFRLRAEDIAF